MADETICHYFFCKKAPTECFSVGAIHLYSDVGIFHPVYCGDFKVKN